MAALCQRYGVTNSENFALFSRVRVLPATQMVMTVAGAILLSGDRFDKTAVSKYFKTRIEKNMV
jgi:hypothetical protein